MSACAAARNLAEIRELTPLAGPPGLRRDATYIVCANMTSVDSRGGGSGVPPLPYLARRALRFWKPAVAVAALAMLSAAALAQTAPDSEETRKRLEADKARLDLTQKR